MVVEGLGFCALEVESLGFCKVGLGVGSRVGFWAEARSREARETSEGLELRPRGRVLRVGLEREVERRGLEFSLRREGEGARREAEKGRGRTAAAPSSPLPRRVAISVWNKSITN